MTQHCRAVMLSVLSVAVLAVSLRAQVAPPLEKIQNQQDLDKAGAALDAALFDSYNKCDLAKFESFFVDDVEFYHDQGGVTLGKAALTDSVRKNICGKVTRELVPGTLKVFYMKGYGLAGDGRTPVSSSRARGHRRRRRRPVHPSLAIQRRSVESHKGDQLRPSCGGEVRAN